MQNEAGNTVITDMHKTKTDNQYSQGTKILRPIGYQSRDARVTSTSTIHN